jgi:MFS family permease
MPRSGIFPVLLVNFIGALGYSIVLPFLVARFDGNAVVYGLLAATYPAFRLLGAPILGRWSDRWGRRRVLLLSQAGTLGAWLVFLAALFLPPSAGGAPAGVSGGAALAQELGGLHPVPDSHHHAALAQVGVAHDAAVLVKDEDEGWVNVPAFPGH